MSKALGRNRLVFYAWFLLVLLMFVAVVVKIVKIQADADNWLNGVEEYAKKVPAEATRGNIFASDGRLLASSLPYYNLFMDTRADKCLVDSFYVKIDSLAMSL